MNFQIGELSDLEVYPTKEFFDNIANAPIIDIRLEEEWLETGILKNSYTITFFDEMGQYNLEEFLQKINKILNLEKSKKFFLICRSGVRTKYLAEFLYNEGYNAISLAGGIFYIIKNNSYEIVPYQN
jgi:rhodanese-related sulfurtransferase